MFRFALSVLALGLMVAPTSAQQKSNDNSVLRILEGVLLQNQPQQPTKPTAPAEPSASCDVVGLTQTYYSLVIHCRAADQWGINTFYIPLQSVSLKGKGGDIYTQMKAEMARTALTHRVIDLTVRYVTADVPHPNYCLEDQIHQSKCREAKWLSLTRNN